MCVAIAGRMVSRVNCFVPADVEIEADQVEDDSSTTTPDSHVQPNRRLNRCWAFLLSLLAASLSLSVKNIVSRAHYLMGYDTVFK